MKDSYYFSHDYNCRTDEKIKKLLMKHGMTGYGIYWSIIEDLYNNANALQTDSERIAYELRTDESIVKSVLNDFNLFVFDGNIFKSLSVEKRLEKRNEISTTATKAANKRWEKYRRNTDAMQPHSESNAPAMQRKGKENKVNINSVYSFTDFWDDYAKKVDSKKCEDKFYKLSEDEIAKIKIHIPKYIASTPDIKFRKNPLTYLNGKCWIDEVKEPEIEETEREYNLRMWNERRGL
jgi:hypothetical protein